jgi:hypothetical protein
MKKIHVANLLARHKTLRAFDNGAAKLPRWTCGSRNGPCGAIQRGSTHACGAACMARHNRMHHACIYQLAPSLAE